MPVPSLSETSTVSRRDGRPGLRALGFALRRSALSPRPHVALVTCARIPDLTPDDRLLADALRARGALVSPVIWDAPDVDWPSLDRAVLRSVWDYHLRPAEFAEWLDARAREGSALVNPAGLVRWNLHKSYLDELAAAGCAVIETVRVPRRAPTPLAALLERRGWTDAVVKPAVSASAHRTFRVSGSDATSRQGDLDAIVDEGDALVQPLAPEILEAGEWSLVFISGALSHAVLKRGAAGEFRVQEEYGGRAAVGDPGARVVADAAAVLSAAPGRSTYARVDGIVRNGAFVLMELELIEPVLYLGLEAGAAGRLADAVLATQADGNVAR